MYSKYYPPKFIRCSIYKALCFVRKIIIANKQVKTNNFGMKTKLQKRTKTHGTELQV